MSLVNSELAVIIPTFRRAPLLGELLQDLAQQDELPGLVVIVDGASEEKTVEDLLKQKKSLFLKYLYVSSNHPNAPYQRYLGAQVAKDHKFVIFFDDDIRLPDKTAIRRMLTPFFWQDRFVVGVTPHIEFLERKTLTRKTNSHHKPGSLTPVGDRIPPDRQMEYAKVDWLRGGVMAYRTQALLPEIYNEDVFALSHVRCGLGVDDTFLSRQVGKHGELIYANCVIVQHPDSDISRAYPTNAFHLGYARAYSRRFLNDNYRITRPPYISDRLALLKSYLGNNLLNFLHSVYPEKQRFDYFRGYFLGSVRGLSRKPTAKKLTPNINWWKDAAQAINQVIEIK